MADHPKVPKIDSDDSVEVEDEWLPSASVLPGSPLPQRSPSPPHTQLENTTNAVRPKVAKFAMMILQDSAAANTYQYLHRRFAPPSTVLLEQLLPVSHQMMRYYSKLSFGKLTPRPPAPSPAFEPGASQMPCPDAPLFDENEPEPSNEQPRGSPSPPAP